MAKVTDTEALGLGERGHEHHRQQQLLLKDLPHSHCTGQSSQPAQLQRHPLVREMGSGGWACSTLAQPLEKVDENRPFLPTCFMKGLWNKEHFSYQWIFKVYQAPFLRIQGEPAYLKCLLLLQGNGRNSLKTQVLKVDFNLFRSQDHLNDLELEISFLHPCNW